MRKICRSILGISALAIAFLAVARPKLQVWGATPDEHAASYPGDDFVPGSASPGTFAATFDAPPAEVWPWLVQMGSDRGGFYSWDALDNGGDPSAEQVNPEWQDLAQGGRINTVPGRSWFDVPLLEPERTLVLRATLDLGSGRSINPTKGLPRAYMDGVWSFHLRPVDGDRTRLIVRSAGVNKPQWLGRIYDLLLFTPAHWIMQTKQLAELKRRVESA